MSRARIVFLVVVSSACSAPKWHEGAELVVRERSTEVVGVLWDDAEGASSYVATLNGERAQEIAAPNVEARFDQLQESNLYFVEVRARNAFGESEPLRVQVRTRDGTPPVFPEGAELVYELSGVARFAWPEATDEIGVTSYELRDADQRVLDTSSETELIYDGVPPQQLELVARDASGNESEPLRVELSDEEMAIFDVRRLALHREIAEELDAEDLGEQLNDLPPGIDLDLLRQIVVDVRREVREN